MKDKVIVITGASSGIGKALAYEFSSHGALLVLGARNEEKLKEIADDIISGGGKAVVVKTDVSVEGDAKNLIEAAIDTFGCIDVLINNAGISMRALFKDVDLAVIKKLMDVNFWGTVYCTKYAMPYLLASGGSVVGVSSIAGYRGLPARAGYSASKFAMHGFLEVLRTENLRTGLHVLLACPGFTTSNIRESSLVHDGSQQGTSPRDETKMMSAEEVARKIYVAVLKRKRTLTLTSQGKLTVILNKLFPEWTDKLVYNHMAKEADSPFR